MSEGLKLIELFYSIEHRLVCHVCATGFFFSPLQSLLHYKPSNPAVVFEAKGVCTVREAWCEDY